MNNQYSEFLLIKDLTLPKIYAPLLKKLIHIYGENLSVGTLKKLPAEDFANKPGIKKSNVDRLKKLQKILDGSKIKLPSLTPSIKNNEETDPSANNQNSNVGPSELEKEFEAHFFRNDSKKQNKRRPKNIRQPSIDAEEDTLLKITFPPEEILDAEIIKKANQYTLSFFHLSKNEQKIFSKFGKHGVTYDQMTPLYVLTIDIKTLRSFAGFGKKGLEALEVTQKRILNDLKKKNPSELLIPKGFGKELSLKEIQKILLEDIETFFTMPLPKELLFIWKNRIGYKTERLVLEKIGRKINKTRERVRQRTNIANESFLQGSRISSDILREKIIAMDKDQILKQSKDLRAAFFSDAEVISFLAMAAKINLKEWI